MEVYIRDLLEIFDTYSLDRKSESCQLKNKLEAFFSTNKKPFSFADLKDELGTWLYFSGREPLEFIDLEKTKKKIPALNAWPYDSKTLDELIYTFYNRADHLFYVRNLSVNNYLSGIKIKVTNDIRFLDPYILPGERKEFRFKYAFNPEKAVNDKLKEIFVAVELLEARLREEEKMKEFNDSFDSIMKKIYSAMINSKGVKK